MIFWNPFHSFIQSIICSTIQQTHGRAVVFSMQSDKDVRYEMVLWSHIPLPPKNLQVLLLTRARLEWAESTSVIINKFTDFFCKMKTNIFYLILIVFRNTLPDRQITYIYTAWMIISDTHFELILNLFECLTFNLRNTL